MATRTLKLDDALLRYIDDHSLREHPAQAALREATRSHPHAGMQIGADQGQFMALLVRLIGVPSGLLRVTGARILPGVLLIVAIAG